MPSFLLGGSNSFSVPADLLEAAGLRLGSNYACDDASRLPYAGERTLRGYSLKVMMRRHAGAAARAALAPAGRVAAAAVDAARVGRGRDRDARAAAAAAAARVAPGAVRGVRRRLR